MITSFHQVTRIRNGRKIADMSDYRCSFQRVSKSRHRIIRTVLRVVSCRAYLCNSSEVWSPNDFDMRKASWEGVRGIWLPSGRSRIRMGLELNIVLICDFHLRSVQRCKTVSEGRPHIFITETHALETTKEREVWGVIGRGHVTTSWQRDGPK